MNIYMIEVFYSSISFYLSEYRNYLQEKSNVFFLLLIIIIKSYPCGCSSIMVYVEDSAVWCFTYGPAWG